MRRSARLVVVGNAIILGLWLWLYQPAGAYVSTLFGAADLRANQLILAGTLALIVLRVRRAGAALRAGAAPQLYAPALVLALGGSLLYLAAERLLDINLLSATIAGLATYGLLGLWMSPRVWRQGFPAALLLIGALPFGDHLDVFVGYPLRIATATIVRDGLAAAGAASLGVDTILVFESGITQVDLPCSGVRSLWTGALFFLAATLLERRRIGPGWLVAGAGFAALMVLANLARVAALVVVGPVLGWPLLAEMLHVPLGVLGFAGACVAAVAMLRRLPALPGPDPGTPAPPRPIWLAPALAGGVLLMALAYSPRPPTVAAA
ncbi:MAG: archaeosortase/exosortase family protein, partial [Chloroflexales bacterium]|nr:archaeosortase/exosortase family protein [Chloroflexales bacterium]